MQRLLRLVKHQIRKSIEKGRAFEDKLGSIARLLWPWRDRWLPVFVLVIAVLDFLSTYLLLEFSGNIFAYEGGLLAGWALRLGGMRWLLLVDILAAGILISVALALRYLFSKWGYSGYSRMFFIILQLPYLLMTAAAIINNILLTFLV